MMDQQHRDLISVRQRFQRGDIPVVIGVGIPVVTAAADALQSVDDHHGRIGMQGEKVSELFLQAIPDARGDGSEVQRLRRVLCDLEQAVLNAGEVILQTEIQYGASANGEIPDRIALRHL